ncbi:MAG: hypothetical protein ACXWPI_15825 [Ktedonobacterales bacterium]
MILSLLIAVLLGLSALLIVIYPLLGLDRTAREALAPEVISDAAERERLAKQALRDVDFDYRLGNLDEGDYASLRDRYERRALGALKTRYDREQELDAQIDQQLAALRAQEPKKNGQATATKPRQTASESVKSGKNGNAGNTGNGTAESAAGKNGTSTRSARQGGPQVRRRKGL